MAEKVNFVDIRYHLWIAQFSVTDLTSTLQNGFCKITGSIGKNSKVHKRKFKKAQSQ